MNCRRIATMSRLFCTLFYLKFSATSLTSSCFVCSRVLTFFATKLHIVLQFVQLVCGFGREFCHVLLRCLFQFSCRLVRDFSHMLWCGSALHLQAFPLSIESGLRLFCNSYSLFLCSCISCCRFYVGHLLAFPGLL